LTAHGQSASSDGSPSSGMGIRRFTYCVDNGDLRISNVAGATSPRPRPAYGRHRSGQFTPREVEMIAYTQATQQPWQLTGVLVDAQTGLLDAPHGGGSSAGDGLPLYFGSETRCLRKRLRFFAESSAMKPSFCQHLGDAVESAKPELWWTVLLLTPHVRIGVSMSESGSVVGHAWSKQGSVCGVLVFFFGLWLVFFVVLVGVFCFVDCGTPFPSREEGPGPLRSLRALVHDG